MKTALLLALPLAFAACAAATGSGQAGRWALQEGAPRVTARLTIAPAGQLGAALDIVQLDSHSRIIDSYATDMTQKMHLIVVSDDFSSFAHLHPALRSGHFTIALRSPRTARYFLYADSLPEGLPQQVFRFTLAFPGARKHVPSPMAVAAARSVGPYTVHVAGTKVLAGRAGTLRLEIDKNGSPADDLRPYLGASAHIVLLDERTLTYTHVHPDAPGSMPMGSQAAMVMASEPVSPKLSARVALREAGRYRMWVQFLGGGRLYAVPFEVFAVLP